jgi:hypothetical protein
MNTYKSKKIIDINHQNGPRKSNIHWAIRIDDDDEVFVVVVTDDDDDDDDENHDDDDNG